MGSNSTYFKGYRWLLLLKVVGLICFAYYLPINFKPISVTWRSPSVLVSERRASSREPRPGYLVDTLNCKIVDMKPLDSSVRKHFKNKTLQSCPHAIIKKTNSRLVYDETHPNFNATSCCFRKIHRISQNRNKYNMVADWQIRFSRDCVQISNASNGTKLTSKFAEIQCTTRVKGKKIKFKEYIAAILPPEIHTNKTKAKVEYWRGRRFDSGENDWEEIKSNTSISPSVLILGIDSISRLHMYRSLAKTKEFLDANDFVEMRGYTKIGDNTFPNMMGALGGMETNKYPCWKKKTDFMDDCPLIWKNFSSSNYVTALLEDSAGIANFNFMKTGFLEEPTDYYLRPITVAYHGRLSRTQSYNGCVGGMSQTNFMMEYLQNFVTAMGQSRVPHFLFSWFTTLGHDSLNDLKVHIQRWCCQAPYYVLFRLYFHLYKCKIHRFSKFIANGLNISAASLGIGGGCVV
ncbi:unnamed protein product [Allacma fusca]|uniref:Uncharacterized protein n=1 Tax=Allacma fusca TaxID=39272 RepID=A0A8J2J281_9HEXA|nr:unnamed protein product [Allacma fusca]